jgi:hypothetical protein
MTQLDKLALTSLATKLGKMFGFGALSALGIYGLVSVGISFKDIVMAIAFGMLGVCLYQLASIAFVMERNRIEREQDNLIRDLKGDE